MSSPDLGPEREFVTCLTESLLYGRKILLRALRGAGRSALLRAVAREYQDVTGQPAVLVRLGDGQTPGAVCAAVQNHLSTFGHAALLLDDWGHLMMTNRKAWQPRLNTICVDAPEAEGVGVLISSDVGENLARADVPGSPLVDAVHEVRGFPLSSRSKLVQDLVHAGQDVNIAEQVIGKTGAHPELIAACLNSALPSAARRLSTDVAASVGQEGAMRILALARRPGLMLAFDRTDERLAPSVYLAEPGRTALSSALVDAGLVELLPGSGDCWPTDRESSARRLLARLISGPECYWFDRYLYSALPDLTATLERVVDMLEGRKLRLRLFSGPPKGVGQEVKSRLKGRLEEWHEAGLSVYWHASTFRDIAALHDRQLVFRSRIDGYHMPPADRVVGQVPPGNENDAYIARAPLGRVEAAWGRSSCWACLPSALPH